MEHSKKRFYGTGIKRDLGGFGSLLGCRDTRVGEVGFAHCQKCNRLNPVVTDDKAKNYICENCLKGLTMMKGITFVKLQQICNQKIIKKERLSCITCNLHNEECDERKCPLWNELKIIEGKQKYGAMADGVGKMPTIKSKTKALKEIIHISQDKRSHLMLEDVCDWLTLKLKIVGVLARKGLKT